MFGDVSYPEVTTHGEAFDAGDEYDDGLGYYPDGVKRTLTDQQIAMFRHSEIYALLRERQVKKENKDAGFDGEPSISNPKDDIHTEAQKLLEKGMESADDNDDDDDEEEEEYAAFLVAEQNQFRTEIARNKRKRGSRSFKDVRNKEPTSRRLARELDEPGAADTVLDYGNEEPEDTTTKRQHPDEEDLDALNGRKRVKYDDCEESPDDAAKAPAVQGRKIWWPTIGS